MVTYSYKAIHSTGRTVQGSIDATSIESAREYLSKQNLTPLSLKPARSVLGLASILSPKVKLRDMVVFTRQLATMINAGVPLVRSLATLQQQTESKVLKKQLALISKDVEGGSTFADSLDKHPATFSNIYVNMVRAGEAAGIMDEILKKLALQQEKDARIRAKFKSAMTYPVILLTITGLVFIGLMTIVMPRIGKIVSDLTGGGELPKLTQAMLGISHFMTHYWYILLALGIGTVVGIRYSTRSPAGRYRRDALLMRIPVLGQIIVKVAVARFARTFASMMTAGVSVLEAIEVTSRAMGNAVLEAELQNAAKMVSNGSQLSQPLSQSKVFPAIIGQMLSVGEETGQVDEVLIKVAEFYEEEVDTTVESLSSILEPIMIVVMGAMVGLIAASVIGPISNLSNQI